jgi:hypothetical protein
MSVDDLNDSMSIDLGNYAAAQPYDNISYSSGVDTIDMSTLTTTITMPSYTSTGSNYTIATGAIGSGYTLGAGASNGTYWTTGTTNITGNGIELDATADIKIGNKSFKAIMEKIEDRLAILTPDPAKLEKFAALKKAYEHYKLMEKLCQEDEEKK